MRMILWIATAVLGLVGTALMIGSLTAEPGFAQTGLAAQMISTARLGHGINLLIASMMTAFGASVLQLLERIAQSGETPRLEAPLRTPPSAGPITSASGSGDAEEDDLAQKLHAIWAARGTPGTMREAQMQARSTLAERRSGRR